MSDGREMMCRRRSAVVAIRKGTGSSPPLAFVLRFAMAVLRMLDFAGRASTIRPFDGAVEGSVSISI